MVSLKPRSLALAFLAAGCTSLVPAAEPAPVKRVALVFDDGPRPADAEPLVALLAREDVKVTFSLVGDRVNESPALAKAVAAAGHEIANHSQAHAHPRDLDDAALDREVGAAQEKITAAVGAAPRWYWPPFLEVDDRVRAAVARARLTVYTPRHLVVSMDYDKSVPAAEILRRATSGVRDGTVILFHEWRAETRDQLPAILAKLRGEGCTFLTFSALFDSLAASDASAAAAAVPVATTQPAASAIASATLPAGGESLLAGAAGPEFVATGGNGNGDAIHVTPVEVAGPGFSRGWRIETSRDLSPAWAVEARTPLARAVKQGDTGLLRFFARTIVSADETGAGQVRAVVQKAGPDYQKSLEKTVTVGAGWQEFLLPFRFAADHAPGAMELAFGFGFKRETVELGGVELLDYGRRVEVGALPRTRFSYAGREPDAAWRRDALARIEQIRKSAFVIEVKDAAGRPAAGATVRVEQRRSAFQFGSALKLARLLQDSPDNTIYRERVLELFNAASSEDELKWGAWDGEWGPGFDRPRTLAALHWLQDHGVPVRGHVLVWPGWKNLPASLAQLNDPKKQAQIPARVLQHIAEVTGATRGLLQEWDVVNEPYDNHDLMALFGADLMVDWFKAAQAGAPGLPLYLNDYANHDLLADKPHCQEFFRTAKFLLAKGAPLTGLGLQAHISAQPNPPENVLATLNVYAELKLPMRFTEFDLDTDDEQLQADYTRDFLILAYSHPLVVGVQHWGFWAGAHWRPQGAMFRADWSEKPSAAAYRDLVLHQWRTQVQGQAGAAGKVGARGFHGEYVVTVDLDGRHAEQKFTLRAGEPKTVVAVTLP